MLQILFMLSTEDSMQLDLLSTVDSVLLVFLLKLIFSVLTDYSPGTSPYDTSWLKCLIVNIMVELLAKKKEKRKRKKKKKKIL